ncbi:TPA: LysR family transcriptional regulator, partial [Legionella pneumophila]|nr:LysR family transcriptional regulator [Legionella pneumophila]
MHMSDIKSFLAVVEFHSISLASKRMHISQPTMTRRIQKIEQELGTPLFFSSGIRTELTAKGKELLPYFRQMLDIYQQMYINVGNKTKNPLKLINVGTSVYVANSI